MTMIPLPQIMIPGNQSDTPQWSVSHSHSFTTINGGHHKLVQMKETTELPIACEIGLSQADQNVVTYIHRQMSNAVKSSTRQTPQLSAHVIPFPCEKPTYQVALTGLESPVDMMLLTQAHAASKSKHPNILQDYWLDPKYQPMCVLKGGEWVENTEKHTFPAIVMRFTDCATYLTIG